MINKFTAELNENLCYVLQQSSQTGKPEHMLILLREVLVTTIFRLSFTVNVINSCSGRQLNTNTNVIYDSNALYLKLTLPFVGLGVVCDVSSPWLMNEA